jgi:hypothetical protein
MIPNQPKLKLILTFKINNLLEKARNNILQVQLLKELRLY